MGPDLKATSSFSEYLSKNRVLPYSKEQIQNYLSKCDALDMKTDNMDLHVKENYKLLSDFFNQIQVKISEN